MAYSLDLLKRVVGFVEEGGSKTEASRRFRVSQWCVQDWCQRPNLAPKRHGPRRRKLDRKALRQHVAQYPEATLKERAQHFGVHINAIWVALKRLKITCKKKLCGTLNEIPANAPRTSTRSAPSIWPNGRINWCMWMNVDLSARPIEVEDGLAGGTE